MRILVIAACPFPQARGTPVRILRLSECFHAADHEVTVATYPLGQEQSLPFRVLRCRGASYYKKTGPGPSLTKLVLLNPALTVLVRQQLIRNAPDVIHAHHIEGLLVALMARRLTRKRIPIVYDAHTSLAEELHEYGPDLLQGLLQGIGGCFDAAFPPRADFIIAVTPYLRDLFLKRKGVSPDQVAVVSNGLEKDFLDKACACTLPPAEPPEILFAGNLAPYQGIRPLLHAFAKVCICHPDAQLTLLTHDDFSSYASLAESLGIGEQVRLERSDLDQLPERLARATVLVNPREHCPGIPQKLLNYMASGRPLVSFAGSATVVTDQVHARVVANGDTEAFAEAVSDLIMQPQQGQLLAAAARTRVSTEFLWPAAAARILCVFRQLTPASSAQTQEAPDV